jgi:general secretion pathway protein M
LKMSRFPIPLRLPEWASQASRTGAAHWRRMSPRERRLAGLTGAVGMMTVAWLVALQPALQTVERLDAVLPRLRADAARLDAVIQEARQLGTASMPWTAPAARTPQALRETLVQARLGEAATVAVAAADRWTVSLDRAPVQEVLAWLLDLPSVLHLQTRGASLRRPVDEQGRMLSGVVSGTITVAPRTGDRP